MSILKKISLSNFVELLFMEEIKKKKILKCIYFGYKSIFLHIIKKNKSISSAYFEVF